MSDKKLKQRNEIPKEYKWNIEAMYPDESQWDADVAESVEKAAEFAKFQGKLTESASTLLEALRERDAIWQKLEHAFVYAAMKKDEDNREDKYQAMDDKCGSAIAKVSASMSFFTPELLEASEETILGYIAEEDGLKQYEFLLKAALKEKISRLNVLEGTKCKLGHPVDVEEYLMYRHCLLYNDVAKDVALINSDPSIRFYFKDNQKEADKLKKFRIELNKAKVNYVQCLGDDDLFDAIYIQYCVINGLPIISSLAEDIIERQNKLDKFSTEEPVKFNKLCSDKNVRLMAVIEKLIARGELVRSEFNQNITTVDGEFIGANMKEAVAWFNNPNNSSVVNAFHNRLKNS